MLMHIIINSSEQQTANSKQRHSKSQYLQSVKLSHHLNSSPSKQRIQKLISVSFKEAYQNFLMTAPLIENFISVLFVFKNLPFSEWKKSK